MTLATSTSSPAPWRRRAAVASRVLAAIAGGWLFSAGFVVLGLALGRRAGLSFADAQTLAWLLAMPLYVAIVCWTFAARSAWRVWAALVGGGLATGFLGWWIA